VSERPVDPANQRFDGESCDFAPPNAPSGHAPGRAVGPRTVILFDGVCDLCDTGMAWLRRHDRNGRFEFLPFQSPEVAARWPTLDPARLAAAVHVITPDGRVHIGADAAAPIFACLPGWGLAARALALPFARTIGRPLYAWIAARRHIFLTMHRPGA
jgi:predicted DCC family thiol-disulfide oxidoreductase YuxK